MLGMHSDFWGMTGPFPNIAFESMEESPRIKIMGVFELEASRGYWSSWSFRGKPIINSNCTVAFSRVGSIEKRGSTPPGVGQDNPLPTG